MAPPWADTVTNIERTKTTKMEMQTCAIMNVKVYVDLTMKWNSFEQLKLKYGLVLDWSTARVAKVGCSFKLLKLWSV
ncbi:hypothetical protein GOBAR_DD25927 [Gossypium barbadense]|nr:hypothetical protein GOBAR_DD25927 [Gossypium barbadense]